MNDWHRDYVQISFGPKLRPAKRLATTAWSGPRNWSGDATGSRECLWQMADGRLAVVCESCDDGLAIEFRSLRRFVSPEEARIWCNENGAIVPSNLPPLLAVEWQERASGQCWKRGARRIPLVDAAHNVVGQFDIGFNGVELVAEEFNVELLQAAISCGHEPALDDIDYREWQLFRRRRGDYVCASWQRAGYTGCILSSRDAATWCNRHGHPVPAIALDDIADEVRSERQQRAATEAPPTEAVAANAAAVEPARESKAAVEARPKRVWTRETAEPVVDAYIKKHPHAKQREIARKTGISHGTVGKTEAWIKEARKRKRRKEQQQGPRGALSFTEKIERLMGGTSDPDIAAVLDRCAIDPEYRQALEKQHDEMAADEAQRRSGRRPVF